MTAFCSKNNENDNNHNKIILKKYTKHKIMKTTFTPVIHPVQARKVGSNVRLSAVTTNDAFLLKKKNIDNYFQETSWNIE